MTAQVSGTFANGQSVGVGMRSQPLVIPSGVTTMRLTLSGDIDASNTVKTRKSTDNGITWADVTTYNSAQTATAVTVVPPIPPAAGEQWILETVAGQANKAINYLLSAAA